MPATGPCSTCLLLALLATSPPRSRPEILSSLPHDPRAYTQGLLLYKGRLFESTGLYGNSRLREVDLESGKIMRQVELPDGYFGEGLARVPKLHGGKGDNLIQLTWREGVAFVYDLETFELVDRIAYPGEGWGLCYDGVRLVMSDGTDRLTFRDPRTFEAIGDVRVTVAGRPRDRLNELECANGAVYANVWRTDLIVRVDPANGAVTGVIDAAGLLKPTEVARAEVLNGIAHVEADRFLLTGKWWPTLFEVKLSTGIVP